MASIRVNVPIDPGVFRAVARAAVAQFREHLMSKGADVGIVATPLLERRLARHFEENHREVPVTFTYTFEQLERYLREMR